MGIKFRIVLVALLIFAGGCISRQRVLPATERPLPAQTASRADLLRGLDQRSREIQTLQATVMLDASGGAMKTGVLTEYRQTKGYIVVERPAHIRIKAQAPLALATVFDMVSDGLQYKVYIPFRNKFIIGNANAPAKEQNPILNLRPQHILSALFVDIVPYLNNPRIRSTLEETTVGRRSFYVFSFIDVNGPNAELIEKLWIDRTGLEITRKEIFSKDGKVDTDVEYSQNDTKQATHFPQVITIKRPSDDYMLKITFQKITPNDPLSADVFNLERPEGADLVRLEPDSGSGR